MPGRPVPILLVVRTLGHGGTERQTAELAKALDRSAFAPHVGCFRGGGFRAEELRESGVPIVEFPLTSLVNASALRAAARLGRYLEEKSIRIVHSFDYPANIFCAPAAKAFRTPVVLTSQRSYRTIYAARYRMLLRLSDLITDGVVVNCEAMWRHLMDDYSVPGEKIHLCYNGLDTQIFHPLARAGREAGRETPLVIGTVTVLRPEKGLRILLEGFALARAERPGIRLLIAGSGPMLAELEAASRELGIAEDCVFEPAAKNVVPWLHTLDIFALPSLYEAFSNSLMEAMACGCCAVASNVGGNGELVEDGETGLLFERGNARDLAQKLVLLIDREDLRKRLADAGAGRIAERFSIQTSVERMETIYDSFLSKAGLA